MLLGTQWINDDGMLEVGGCSAVELARQFGTPLYVLDEDCLREKCRQYRRAFESRYPSCHISFSGKVCTTMAVFRIAEQEGLGLDVSSDGELYTGLESGFAPERMVFHGSNKSRQELEMAVTHRVGRVGLDHMAEIAALQRVAAARDAIVDVLVRVAPGVDADTHTHIQTGKADTKFGFAIVGGDALAAVRDVLDAPNLRFQGINCHVGSQILSAEPFVEAAEAMLDFAAEIRSELGCAVAEVDLGGGLGVRYLPTDEPPSLDEYAEALTGAVRSRCERHDLPLPRLIQEPGRSLAGEAGVTLYAVGVVKEIAGVRTYVSVDGGMSDNPRPALYGAKYDAIVANKAGQPVTSKVTVVGKHCEADTLIAELEVPEVAPGDILAVQTTGAYNYSMASNYNRLRRPAVVAVTGGRADLIVERESLNDQIRLDRIPDRLQGTASGTSAA